MRERPVRTRCRLRVGRTRMQGMGEKIMDNIGNGLIVVLASFLVGTFICGIAYLIEKILIWDLFLNEIPDGNKKVFADASSTS